MPQRPASRRILCVTSNYPRWFGDATTPFVWHLAQDLQDLDWIVDVLAPHAPGAARQEVLGGVYTERFRYAWPATHQTVCYQGGALINLRQAPTNYLKLPSLVIAEWIAIMRRLQQRRYSLVHSHWILPQGFTGCLARAAYPGPHVITVHGGDIFGLTGRLMTRFKRASLHCANAITVNSATTEHAVRSLITKAQPPAIQRIPMGVNINAITPRQRLTAHHIREQYCPSGRALVLFVGRLIAEKGVADLLQALALCRHQHPSIHLLLLGSGQQRPEFEHLAHQLGIASTTHFCGWIDSAAVTHYLAAADLCVAPSRRAANGWIEAQGLSVIEAMAAGTPVIATACGGLAELIQHDVTGWQVPEHDPRQLATAIIQLLRDPERRQRLAETARQQVTKHFSRAQCATRFNELFETLCLTKK
jgi:glycosyltransferase involved in cell wall biosynthesis